MPDMTPIYAWLVSSLGGLINVLSRSLEEHGNVPDHWREQIRERGESLVRLADQSKEGRAQATSFQAEGFEESAGSQEETQQG